MAGALSFILSCVMLQWTSPNSTSESFYLRLTVRLLSTASIIQRHRHLATTSNYQTLLPSAMAYHLLSDKSSGSDDVDDAQHESGYKSRFLRFDRLKGIRNPLQIYTALISTVLCILLFLNLPDWNQKDAKRDHSADIELIYSQDLRYMTLDHQYDHLWEKWGPDAQINVTDDQLGGGEIAASISMWVLPRCSYHSFAVLLSKLHRLKRTNPLTLNPKVSSASLSEFFSNGTSRLARWEGCRVQLAW